MKNHQVITIHHIQKLIQHYKTRKFVKIDSKIQLKKEKIETTSKIKHKKEKDVPI